MAVVLRVARLKWCGVVVTWRACQLNECGWASCAAALQAHPQPTQLPSVPSLPLPCSGLRMFAIAVVLPLAAVRMLESRARATFAVLRRERAA